MAHPLSWPNNYGPFAPRANLPTLGPPFRPQMPSPAAAASSNVSGSGSVVVQPVTSSTPNNPNPNTHYTGVHNNPAPSGPITPSSSVTPSSSPSYPSSAAGAGHMAGSNPYQLHQPGGGSLTHHPQLQQPQPPQHLMSSHDVNTYNLVMRSYHQVYRQSSPTNCTVYIGGIMHSLTEELIHRIFHPFGPIQEIRVFKEKGYSFVKYMNKESAACAIVSLHHTEVNGCVVKCSWGRETPNPSHQVHQVHLAQVAAAQQAQVQAQAAVQANQAAVAQAAAQGGHYAGGVYYGPQPPAMYWYPGSGAGPNPIPHGANGQVYGQHPSLLQQQQQQQQQTQGPQPVTYGGPYGATYYSLPPAPHHAQSQGGHGGTQSHQVPLWIPPNPHRSYHPPVPPSTTASAPPQ